MAAGLVWSTTAMRVGTDAQPTGRAMPRLLPYGPGPRDHNTVALATVHPLARPPTVLECVGTHSNSMNGVRTVKRLRARGVEILRTFSVMD